MKISKGNLSLIKGIRYSRLSFELLSGTTKLNHGSKNSPNYHNILPDLRY